MNGFLCVDKPAGPSSFAVVRRARQAASERRAGHAGTLDPDATGLLVLALGTATRLLPFLPVDPKTYVFGVQFGSETDTLDKTGSVVRQGGRIPSADEIRGALGGFAGEQSQVPPRYSSVKIKGVRAYKLARREQTFELRPRTIRIHALTLDSYDEAKGEARMTVSCSSGTYVRSLARDIAAVLGTYGYASSVRRTRSGAFAVENAAPFDALRDDLSPYLLTARAVFEGFPTVMLSEAQVVSVRHGSPIRIDAPVAGDKPVFAYDQRGELGAVLQRAVAGEWRPIRVF